MTVIHSQNHQKSQENSGVSVGQLIERLSHFDGPPGQFLVNLLAVQCFLAKAEAGAILRAGKAKTADVLAVYPQLEENAAAPIWLSQAIAFAAKSTSAATVIKPLYETEELYGQPAQRYLVMIQLKMAGVEQAAAAFLIETGQLSVLEASTERLELTASLLSLYEMRLIMQNQQFDLARMQTAMELLESLNQQEKFTSAAMALCNETAARWQCQRVSVGLLKGRYVQVKAISHTENFSRKMKVVQDIESTMEECLDQDIEILYPASADAVYVSRAAERLSKRYGPMIVLSLPLRRNGQVLGVLSLERDAEKPFTLDQIETIRLCCQLCTSRLLDLYQSNRWIGAKIASALQNSLSSLARPKHTWAKIAAVVILAALVFLLFAEGRFKAQSTFVFEATQRQFIPAPFDGYIKSSGVLVGRPRQLCGTEILRRHRSHRLTPTRPRPASNCSNIR
jgi:hypothetical protein